jgi:hypothetical protein
MEQFKCEFCGKENELSRFWIPACCVSGYFQIPFNDLSSENVKEAEYFIGRMCPTCGCEPDNGFDRSYPEPVPYQCVKCTKGNYQ